ncbi:unnamed protein product [Bursaphelenchus okinawaensis]|uniref:ZP domain-containing protein n=1 Tax=Bursaphelenchus okinawaensis TaxID=465554 RepID=A0A811JT56_9BILA|nr:unnamed protein product [Bursaphelenchus okinawaensis]CAG9081384.1 unnamed protein product [Bursaphelenchus okinawaensis]
MKPFIGLCFLVGTVTASLFCPYTVYPSNQNEMVTATIQAKQMTENSLYYRITDNESDPSYKRLSPHFKLMTVRDNNECPFRGCMVELSPAEPKNHQTRLYQTSVIGKMIPPGFFSMDVSQRLYCVLTEGDCGATVPLYRHYKVTPQGIFHAYTVDPSDVIEGYIKESTPLCYVWARNKATVAHDKPTVIPSLEKIIPKIRFVSHEKEFDANSQEDNTLLDIDELCAHDNRKSSDSSMKELLEFYNNKEGADKDHLYTVKRKVNGYKKQKVLGKIVTDVKKSGCKCLVQLAEMKFQAAGGLPGLDHKLAREQIEPPTLNQYFLTGERYYCAPQQGECGATVPLRKWYNFGEADSIITADSEVAPAMTGPFPGDVLCWIWPQEYRQDSTEYEVEEEGLQPVKVPQKKQKKVESESESEESEIQGSGSGEETSSEESSDKSVLHFESE